MNEWERMGENKPRVTRCYAIDRIVVTELDDGQRNVERCESREDALQLVEDVWGFDRLMALADGADGGSYLSITTNSPAAPNWLYEGALVWTDPRTGCEYRWHGPEKGT